MIKRTILHRGTVAGHMVRFSRDGDAEITYWIDREVWGLGIATTALGLFLGEVTERPLLARVAADNAGSTRVLEKCGFVRTRSERGYANARCEEIEEYVYLLQTSRTESSLKS